MRATSAMNASDAPELFQPITLSTIGPRGAYTMPASALISVV